MKARNDVVGRPDDAVSGGAATARGGGSVAGSARHSGGVCAHAVQGGLFGALSEGSTPLANLTPEKNSSAHESHQQ